MFDKSVLRQPCGAVKVNGVVMSGWVSFSFDANSFHDPDTFDVAFAISALPEGNGIDWFSQQTQLEVEIFAGFPSDPSAFSTADLDSIFFGRADEAAPDLNAWTITLTGRDMTAVFLDAKTSEKYIGQTASDVATLLAGKYGLTPVVTDTSTKIGRYLQADMVERQDQRTEWDLLTWLARQEGFVVFVKGKELHFEPPAQADANPYVIAYTPPTAAGPATCTMERVSCRRVLTVARDIVVTVRSFNSKSKKAFTQKATRTKTRGKRSASSVQQYTYTIPGLTPEQAQQRANQLLAELSQHEMTIALEGPADNVLAITSTIQLKGTGSAWDQTYYPDSIHRTFTTEGGYSWSVSGKNHSPESEPNI